MWGLFVTADPDLHYSYIIMGVMTSQITSLTIVYSTVYSGADQRKHQSSVSLGFVWGIHRRPVNSPHKGPVKRKIFFLMMLSCYMQYCVIPYRVLTASDCTDAPITYRQVSNIRRTKSQLLKVPRTVLRLSLPNPLKPDVKSRMKM